MARHSQRSKFRLSIAVFALLSYSLFASQAYAGSLDSVSGLWLTEAKTGHVEISDCGDGTPCGTLVWVQTDQDVDIPLDINNKDPELAKRPLIGIKILYGFTSKKSKWKGGKIYNAADGKTYGSSLKEIDANQLQVKGCVGPICQKQIWTRVKPQN